MDAAGETGGKKRRLRQENVTSDEAAAQSEDVIAVSSISDVEQIAVAVDTLHCEYCLMEFQDIDELRYHLLETHGQEYEDVEELDDVEEYQQVEVKELSVDDKDDTQYVLVVPS